MEQRRDIYQTLKAYMRNLKISQKKQTEYRNYIEGTQEEH